MNTSTQMTRALVVAAVLALLAACGQKSPEKLTASAREYLAKGERTAAIIQLKNALQKAPDDGEARLLLGKTQLELHDYASAEKELRRALDLKQSEDKVLPLLARTLVESGQGGKLIQEFAQARLADPSAEASLQTWLGGAYLSGRQLDNARAAYAAAQSAVPGYPLARVGDAMVALEDHRPDDAMQITDGVIADAPKLAEAFALKADLLLLKGQVEDARKSLESAVAADREFLPARYALIAILIDDKAYEAAGTQISEVSKIAGRQLQLVYFESLLAFHKGDNKAALDTIQQVLKVAPSHVPSLVLAAAIELQEENFASAEAHLQSALVRAPGNAMARRMLVATQLRMGHPAQAKETLQPLLEQGAATDPQFLLLAGETFLANGDLKEASVYYQSASSKSGGQRATAYQRLGQIALATGSPEQGIKELETASQLDAGNFQADLALITNYLRTREYDRAMAAVQALEKKQPNNPLTFQMYGVVHLAKHDTPAARRNFEKALELQQDYLPAAYNLAMLDIAEKRPDDARKRYESMLAKDPKNAQLYLALAGLQLRTGADMKEVGATLQRATEANPQSVPARLAVISFHLSHRDPKAALNAAQNANAAIAHDPRIQDALGLAQEAAGETSSAIETYNRLVARLPDSAQPLFRLAALYARQKDTDKAVNALRRAEKVVSDRRQVVPLLVQVYMDANRADDALKEVKALQNQEPKYAGGWSLEGDIYRVQRKYADAEKAYREALKREPKSAAIAVSLRGVLLAADKGTEADLLARKWLADNPKDSAMRMHLAERDLAAKNYKSAAALYEAVVAQEPNNGAALNNLAWVLGELNDPKAIGVAERALAVAPNSANVLDTLGLLLVDHGDAKKGVEYLARATKLAPERANIRLHYAKGLIKTGQKEAARKELSALAELKEDFPGKGEIVDLLKGL